MRASKVKKLRKLFEEEHKESNLLPNKTFYKGLTRKNPYRSAWRATKRAFRNRPINLNPIKK